MTRTHAYDATFANTFDKAQHASAGFLNDYYDDEGWWALAWIDVYDLTHEERYLGMAVAIFKDMAQGWDGTCGGGIWWSKERKYKNAIANELFLSVAAHLARRAKDGKENCTVPGVGVAGVAVVCSFGHDQRRAFDQRRPRCTVREQSQDHMDLYA